MRCQKWAYTFECIQGSVHLRGSERSEIVERNKMRLIAARNIDSKWTGFLPCCLFRFLPASQREDGSRVVSEFQRRDLVFKDRLYRSVLMVPPNTGSADSHKQVVSACKLKGALPRTTPLLTVCRMSGPAGLSIL
jgi:hypothetical protein